MPRMRTVNYLSFVAPIVAVASSGSAATVGKAAAAAVASSDFAATVGKAAAAAASPSLGLLDGRLALDVALESGEELGVLAALDLVGPHHERVLVGLDV